MTPYRCDRCRSGLSQDAPRYLAVLEIAHVADPPEWTEEDQCRDFEAEIRELLKAMEGCDPKELEEQVYVRRCLSLCTACRQRVLDAMSPNAPSQPPPPAAERHRATRDNGAEE